MLFRKPWLKNWTSILLTTSTQNMHFSETSTSRRPQNRNTSSVVIRELADTDGTVAMADDDSAPNDGRTMPRFGRVYTRRGKDKAAAETQDSMRRSSGIRSRLQGLRDPQPSCAPQAGGSRQDKSDDDGDDSGSGNAEVRGSICGGAPEAGPA